MSAVNNNPYRSPYGAFDPKIESSSKQIEDKIQDLVTEKSLVNDSFPQGRIKTAPLNFRAVALSNANKPVTVLKTQKIAHETAIFGSYSLEDVRAISTAITQNHGTQPHYHCFNYESEKEILDRRETSAYEHIHLLKKNLERLAAEHIPYTMHYKDKRNNLLERPNDRSDWQKWQREYTQNMVFFNPYLKDKEGTEELLEAFFKYAEVSLKPEGALIMMWNPKRKDNLQGIDFEGHAKKHGFNIAKKVSAKNFILNTGFNHLKNSTSLNNGWDSRVKSVGSIYVFNRSGDMKNIDLNGNQVADAIINSLTQKEQINKQIF